MHACMSQNAYRCRKAGEPPLKLLIRNVPPGKIQYRRYIGMGNSGSLMLYMPAVGAVGERGGRLDSVAVALHES